MKSPICKILLKMKMVFIFGFLFLFTLVPPVLAQEPGGSSHIGDLQLNIIWVLVAGVLVFLMQAGFMCVEAGLAQAKHSINVAVKNLADYVLSVTLFWAIGFGLMFGVSHSGWFGSSMFLINLKDPWLVVFFVFQSMFVGTAATIDSGAVAGRTRFMSYLLISCLVSAIIYPVFGHWAWGGLFVEGQTGWLEKMGFLDFAGSTVVHSVGGWVALAGIIVVGPRTGKFGPDGKPRAISPHNMTLAYLGTFILFFGWFGFNCGSTLEVSNDVAGIAMNTMLGGCFGCISASALSWVNSPFHRPEGEMIANGILGGLVAVTAGCAYVEATGAMIIGLVAGLVVYFGVNLVEKVFKLDDVVGAVTVHGFCGAWGTLAVGLFITPAHLGTTTRLHQLGVQALGVGACFVWAFILSYICLKFIGKITGGLRVSLEEEHVGLNFAEHGAKEPWAETIDAIKHIVTTGDFTKRVVMSDTNELAIVAHSFNALLDEVQVAVDAVSRVAQGELNIQITPKSEQDVLGQATKLMVNNLQTLVGNLEEITRFLSSSADHIEVSGRDLKSANEDLSEKVDAVMSNIRVVSDEIRQMEESIELKTSQTIDHVEREFEGFEKRQDRLAGSVQNLESKSQLISKFVKTINNIAMQTKILSINAAIEAASAGSYGRSFGVVADQIRELALRSQDTAGEIDLVIASVLTDINSASLESQESIKSSTNLKSDIITDLDDSLTFIRQTERDLSRRMTVITAAADDQQTALSQTQTAVAYNTSIGSKLLHQVKRLQKALSVFHLRRHAELSSVGTGEDTAKAGC